MTTDVTLQKVRLSVSNAVHSLAILVARDEGLFRDHGLEVEIVRTPGSAHVDTDRQAAVRRLATSWTARPWRPCFAPRPRQR